MSPTTTAARRHGIDCRRATFAFDWKSPISPMARLLFERTCPRVRDRFAFRLRLCGILSWVVEPADHAVRQFAMFGQFGGRDERVGVAFGAGGFRNPRHALCH